MHKKNEEEEEKRVRDEDENKELAETGRTAKWSQIDAVSNLFCHSGRKAPKKRYHHIAVVHGKKLQRTMILVRRNLGMKRPKKGVTDPSTVKPNGSIPSIHQNSRPTQ